MIVEVKETEDGDLFIEFPDEMVEQLGWVEGTEVVWIDNGDGTWTVRNDYC